MKPDPLQGREVIYELIPLGMYVRISAMDTKTLTEIAISCPKGTAEDIMKRNARRRLAYVMRKKGLI